MITFKDYLEEGVNDYFLYHGTTLENAETILKVGEIVGLTQHMSNVFHTKKKEYSKKHGYENQWVGTAYNGVSLTRNPRFAKNWANTNAGDGDDIVVFKLDRRKLMQKYRILPVDFFGNAVGARSESEEFVLGKIKPLNTFLIETMVFNTLTKHRIEIWSEDYEAIDASKVKLHK
jgi:hypothetical protein